MKKLYKEFLNYLFDGDVRNVKLTFKPEYLNERDNQKNGSLIIHLASFGGFPEIVLFLLDNEANIESCDFKGWRPIHHAVCSGNKDVVKLLIGHNCQLDCKTNKNETPFVLVNQKKAKKYLDIANLITQAIRNRPIGNAMQLRCSNTCDHNFCLQSFSALEFEVGEEIGSGAAGKVYKVMRSHDNFEFAYKIVSWLEVDPERDKDIDRKAIGLEIEINKHAQTLIHERIVKYYGSVLRYHQIFIFMEFVGDSIEKKIKRDKVLANDLIKKYTKQILEGLAFLHGQNIIHRDIKPANVLLDSKDNCKLTDLGCSRFVQEMAEKDSFHKANSSDDQISNKSFKPTKDNGKTENLLQATTFCGTPNYMAPEILKGESYSFEVDIWAVGATLVEMLTGKPPFYGLPMNQVIFKICKERTIEYSLSQLSEDLQLLIKELLDPDKKNRKSANEILKFCFFIID